MSDFIFSKLFENRFYSVFGQVDSFFELLTSSSKNIIFFQPLFQDLFEHQSIFSDILNITFSKESFFKDSFFKESNTSFLQRSSTASKLLIHKTIERKNQSQMR